MVSSVAMKDVGASADRGDGGSNSVRQTAVPSRPTDCMSCRISGSVAFMLIAVYFYRGCKHVKPVYYVGTPSMIFLAVARAFDFPPFNNEL